jgi:signal transduction histidine kinase
MQEAIQTRDKLRQAQNRELAETNEKLRETNSNYMTTLRFITHELKAPLAAMQSMIDVLLGSLLGDVPEKMRHPLVRIKRNCEELQDMVKNYLDLARAERGELVADKTPIDLRPDVVDPAVTQARPLLESRSVTLEVDCPETLALTADADLLRIALGNYLSNAAKYGKEGGLARLEVRVQHDSVTVSVWNEGVGFSTDEARRLFDKFSRLRNANTRDKRGSGLGLFISGQIVALHGGTVWAESEEGKWARFSLRLPLDGAVATEH